MNFFRDSKRKVILIIAAIAVVLVIIFLISWLSGKEESPSEDPNAVTGGAQGDYNDYAVGQTDEEEKYPDGIIVISDDGDDYNIMQSDRGLLSPDGSLSTVGGSKVPADGVDLSGIQKGEGTATILIYCIGSQLESECGCATADIREMLESGIGRARNVNVIIETGGAKEWKNAAVSASKLQRFRLLRDGMYPLEEEEPKNMASASTLREFITWGAQNYPADTFGLIIWGKAGGPAAGIGRDELFGGALQLTDIDEALNGAGAHFDFIGFDASLMGSLETAYMLAEHADYMIASEETEPGGGWYYTGWMKLLAQNPGIDIGTAAKQLADDMIIHSGTCGQSVSLSAVRLDKISGVYTKLCAFLTNANNALNGAGFAGLSGAVYNTAEFGYGRYGLRDIADLANRSGIEGANELIAAIDEAVIYNNTNLKYANGLSMYFPYGDTSGYQQMSEMIRKLGMTDPAYDSFFEAYLAKMGSGWALAGAMSVYADTRPEMTAKDEDDYYAVKLTPEQLGELVHYDAELYIDDGQGYIVMGCDDLCGQDKDLDIMLDFDNTWISLEEQPVCIAVREEGEYADGSRYTHGIVNAVLTGADGAVKNIELIVAWDENHSEGYVKGYRNAASGRMSGDVAEARENGGMPASYERALMQFDNGDRLRFVYDYYTYAGEFLPEYRFSDEITVNEEIEVSYEEIDELNAEVAIRFVDIYNNVYRSQRVKY